MAGRIPELKDLEQALFESTDEPSAVNAFKEYQRRGGGNLDSAAKALRMRLDAIASNGSIEHYGRVGLTSIPADRAGGGPTSHFLPQKTQEPLGGSRKTENAPSLGESPSGLVGSPRSLSTKQTAEEMAGGGLTQPVQSLGDVVHQSEGPPPATSILKPTVTPELMREAIDAWDKIALAIQRPEDLCEIEGRPYRRASFWRKVGMAYSVEVKVLTKSSTSGWKPDDEPPTAEVHLRLTVPSGRFVESIGSCHAKERRFRKKDGSWLETNEHQIVSLAYTRAYCRGMRTLIGFGEPSAEEVE